MSINLKLAIPQNLTCSYLKTKRIACGRQRTRPYKPVHRERMLYPFCSVSRIRWPCESNHQKFEYHGFRNIVTRDKSKIQSKSIIANILISLNHNT